MANLNFALSGIFRCEEVKYLDALTDEYKSFPKPFSPELIQNIDFKETSFVFDLEDPDDEYSGFSLTCTKTHRRKDRDCSAIHTDTLPFIEFNLSAVISVPLRANPDDVKGLRLSLMRLDYAKSTPNARYFSIDRSKPGYIPFSIE